MATPFHTIGFAYVLDHDGLDIDGTESTNAMNHSHRMMPWWSDREQRLDQLHLVAPHHAAAMAPPADTRCASVTQDAKSGPQRELVLSHPSPLR